MATTERQRAALSVVRPLVQVTVAARDARTGRFLWRRRYKNTLTNYALATVAQWLAGTANVPGGSGGLVSPAYVALGNGSGTPAPTDIAAFAEVDGARVLASSAQQYQTYYAMIVGFFGTAPAVNYTEAVLLDGPTGSAGVGTGGVAQGAASLPLAAGAPAVTGSATAGQRTTVYFNDGTNSEYAAIAASASSGASSWTLAAGLAHAHAAAVPIVVFGGNAWAHVSLSNADLSAGGQTLTVQWKILVAGN